MLKPTSTFKLSKTTKRILALTKWTNKEQRDSWKRSMIQAELAEKIVVKVPQRDKNAPRGTSNYQTNDTGTASTQV